MKPRAFLLAALCALAVLVVAAPIARADGDPGSDVLVYQDLFVGSTAGPSIQQQAQLGGLLKAAARSRFPIRVAVIASRSDLGAVTELWRNPRAYARFLGLELSLAYKQRLLVVMPNGFGFNWPGHSSAPAYQALSGTPVGSGDRGLLAAAQAAVRKLALADGVRLPSVAGSSAGSATATASPNNATSSSGKGASVPRRSTENLVGIIALALCVIAVITVAVRRIVRRGAGPWVGARGRNGSRREFAPRRRWVLTSAVLIALLPAVAIVALRDVRSTGASRPEELAFNPYLDPGTPVSRTAPAFTLSDQFGERVSLHSFRGKVVLLAFNDSECTTVCPLTTTAMLQTKAMLGKAGTRVQLLGIDANPAAISLEDVWSYSELHGMLRAWHFLTGSLPQLRQVWKQYAVEAAIEHGEITHSPALFVIDPQGREAKVYITQMSYAAIGQLGQVLANEVSQLLPNHPPVRSDLSYARVPPITPQQSATLPRAGGGTVELGPGKSAHVYVFFATWDQETSGLAGELDSLNGYAASAARLGLPPLTAIDEASVEPSSAALGRFLRRIPHPLSYPVAIDRSGRVADGYEVLGAPWFVVTSATGKLLYYQEVSTAGWPSRDVLIRYVRAALARAPRTTGSSVASQSHDNVPPALATIHTQANRLLGAKPTLAARIRALRGYPIVINAWASWCVPCRSEFGLFASASERYDSQVAFLGADTDDSPGDARSFLDEHPVGYPSYQMTTASLRSLAVLSGLPTTIYINSAGKIAFVHTGQYDSQGTLDQDIATYALG